MDPSTETATQALHRITSYGRYDASDPDLIWAPPVDDPRVVADLVVNDTDRLPWFYKRYPDDLPTVSLPRDLPTTSAPAVAVLAGTAAIAPGTLDLPQLARVLHLAAGIVRTMVRPYATWLFRNAGSAGGRFPLELYVAVPDGHGVPAGVHWYHPEEHALVRIGPAPDGGTPTVVVTGVPWRTGWSYRERGYRHVYWDAGTMLSQLLTAAASAGLAPALTTRFPDSDVTTLVGADGVHEWPVALVTMGEGSPAIAATGPAVTGQVDVAPVEFPLVTAAQRAGDLDALGSPWPSAPPVSVPVVDGPSLDEVIRSRGSTRLLDPTRSVSLDMFRTSMLAGTRGIDVRARGRGARGRRDRARHLHVARARPAASRRRPRQLYVLALEQGLAQEAAFVTIGIADVGSLDDRAYREAQLGSGIVEGRLHLLAYAMGAAASGMTFADSELADVVGEPTDGLLLTCVGVPEYRSATAGPPGAPVEVATVTARTS